MNGCKVVMERQTRGKQGEDVLLLQTWTTVRDVTLETFWKVKVTGLCRRGTALGQMLPLATSGVKSKVTEPRVTWRQKRGRRQLENDSEGGREKDGREPGLRDCSEQRSTRRRNLCGRGDGGKHRQRAEMREWSFRKRGALERQESVPEVGSEELGTTRLPPTRERGLAVNEVHAELSDRPTLQKQHQQHQQNRCL